MSLSFEKGCCVQGETADRMTTGYDHRDPRPELVPRGSWSGTRSSLQLCLSHPWLILHVGRAGVMGEAPVSRGSLLGAQRPAPAPLPSPFCLVPSATSHRVSRDPSGPPPTCHSSLSPLTRGEKGWQEHLPIWRAVLAPVRLHQQRNHEHCKRRVMENT